MPTTPVTKMAQFLSRIFHPLVIIALTAFFLNSNAHQDFALGARDTLILVLCLAPGLYYFANRKRRGEKIQYAQIVLPLLLTGLIVTFCIYWLIESPIKILQGVLIALIVGAGATVIEKRWDISNHAWVPMCCAALWLPFYPNIAICLGIVGLIAGLARLPLHQHSFLEVVAGWVYGFFTTYLLVATILM